MPTHISLPSNPTCSLEQFFQAWAALSQAPLQENWSDVRREVLSAVLPYAFPRLDGAELADDVWQTAMSWFVAGDVLTHGALSKFQTNLNQEVAQAAQSWVNYQRSKLTQATQALEVLLKDLGSGQEEGRKTWMTHGLGFDWWVSSSVLELSHKKVCMALLSSGLLEQNEVQAAWERLHHPLASRQHHRQIKKKGQSNWKADAWPEEWSVAWEHGRLKRRHGAIDRDKVIEAL